MGLSVFGAGLKRISYQTYLDYHGPWGWGFALLPSLNISAERDYINVSQGIGLNPDACVIRISLSWLFWCFIVKGVVHVR